MAETLHRPIIDLIDPRARMPGEKFYYEFHHRVRIAGAGPFVFFVNTNAQPPIVTNWPFGDARMSAGNALEVYGIGFEFASPNITDGDGNANWRRVMNACNNLTAEFRVESKDYLRCPLQKLGHSGGIRTEPASRNLDIAGPGNPSANPILGRANPLYWYTLRPGIYIGPLYQFRFRLVTEAAIADPGGAINVRAYLAGVWERNIQ